MWRVGWCCLALPVSLAAAPEDSFAPDPDTLLLGRFNPGLAATVAHGEAQPAGHAGLAPGGPDGTTAAVLRRGLSLSEDGVQLPFIPLTWPLAGHCDPGRGTAELAFQPAFSAQADGWHLLLESGRGFDGIQLGLRVADGRATLELREWEAGAEARVLAGEVPLTPGQWLRIALTWTGTRRELWLDGRPLAATSDAPAMLTATGDVWRLGGTRTGADQADGLVDDLRISGVVRYGS